MKCKKNIPLQEAADVLYTRAKTLLDGDDNFKDSIFKARKASENKSLSVDLQEQAIAFLMCLDKVKDFLKKFAKKNYFIGSEEDLNKVETDLYFLSTKAIF